MFVKLWFTCGEPGKTPPGYHPRIFLLGNWREMFDSQGNDTPLKSAHDLLKEASLWKGTDKRWEGKNRSDGDKNIWLGYEIHSDFFDAWALKIQKVLGEPMSQKQVRAELG